LKVVLTEQEHLQKMAITRILRWAYGILPLGYLLIIITRIFTGHWETVYFMFVAFGMTVVAYVLLRKDKVETSISVFIVSLIILITVLCSLNNGIHDIGIVAYPVVLLLSSMMLRPWQQAASFVLVLLSITWLAMGEAWKWYTPEPAGKATIAELILIFVVIVISALICYRIARQLKKMVARTDKEVQRRVAATNQLQEALAQKVKLTSAVHAQVANSIAIIRELLTKQNDQSLPKLPDQLLTIELIHSELNRLGIERQLALDGYLNALFTRQTLLYEGVAKHIQPDVQVNVDQAMAIGLLMNEIAQQQYLTGSLVSSLKDEKIKLTLTSDPPLFPLTALAEIMVRQLMATTDLSSHGLTIEFASKSTGNGK
jgi:hypothetical protein